MSKLCIMIRNLRKNRKRSGSKDLWKGNDWNRPT